MARFESGNACNAYACRSLHMFETPPGYRKDFYDAIRQMTACGFIAGAAATAGADAAAIRQSGLDRRRHRS